MDAQKLHQALLSPQAYPDEAGPISCVETHVSRLYFTPSHVYKVKKPVDFGFLNFTTLDRRRFYCQEEVRLNQRLCPDTYLGVVEIRQQGRRIRIDADGDIVDYAVLMNRLPQDRMLDHLIETTAPGLEQEMGRLGERIAGFHAAAPIHRGGAGRSHLEVMQFNWQENFEQTAPFSGQSFASGVQELVADYVRDFFNTQASLLEHREQRGFVREGHGDLHAEHICLTDPIRVYDCIEFNQRFRVGDVVNDLAFLIMDLDYRGRRDLALSLLAAYRASFGADPDLQTLLPFYQIYRAWVRGKVDSFLARDKSAEKSLCELAQQKARRYFNLALGYLCPPVLIMTCGLMGVGKTTLAKALASATGALLLRSDQLRKQLAGLSETAKSNDPFGTGLYSPQQTERTYAELLRQAEICMRQGQAVIVDASFSRRSDRVRFVRAAEAMNYPWFILHLQCPQKLALQRLDRRSEEQEDASDGRSAIYADQAAAFEPIAVSPQLIRVDTDENVDYNASLVLRDILKTIGGDR